jgi:hypothetical protein
MGTGAIVVTCSLAFAQQTVIEVRKVYIERPPQTVAIVDGATFVTDTIQFFRDPHFKHQTDLANVSVTQTAGQAHEMPSGLEDSVSSLRWSLPPGVLVMLYEDDGAKGEQLALWGIGQIDSLATFDFDNKASQWAWYYVGSAPHSSEVILRGAAVPVGAVVVSSTTPVPQSTLQMFKSKNFEANTVTLNPLTQAANTLHTLPEDLPDSLTSLRWNLPPGVVLMFHQDADGGKQQVALWGSGEIADLDVWDFNDKASRWAWHYVGSPEVEVVGYEPHTTTVVAPGDKRIVVVEDVSKDAIELVARDMTTNELQIKVNDLVAKKNPTGDGTFVYVPKTNFDGVERRVIWLVNGNRAYALTGAAKLVTPNIITPAEVGDEVWAKTGINRLHCEDDAAKIVFVER